MCVILKQTLQKFIGQKKLLLILALLITIMYSCNSSNGDNDSNSDTNDKMETTSASEASSTTASKVKFAPFKNIDDVRQKLSAAGIGELGRWRDDEMGGYMSITSYYQFLAVVRGTRNTLALPFRVPRTGAAALLPGCISAPVGVIKKDRLIH